MQPQGESEHGGIDRHHPIDDPADDRHDGDGDRRRTAGHDEQRHRHRGHHRHHSDGDRHGRRDRNALNEHDGPHPKRNYTKGDLPMTSRSTKFTLIFLLALVMTTFGCRSLRDKMSGNDNSTDTTTASSTTSNNGTTSGSTSGSMA